MRKHAEHSRFVESYQTLCFVVCAFVVIDERLAPYTKQPKGVTESKVVTAHQSNRFTT